MAIFDWRMQIFFVAAAHSINEIGKVIVTCAYRKAYPARMLLKISDIQESERRPPLHNSGCHNVTLR